MTTLGLTFARSAKNYLKNSSWEVFPIHLIAQTLLLLTTLFFVDAERPPWTFTIEEFIKTCIYSFFTANPAQYFWD